MWRLRVEPSQAGAKHRAASACRSFVAAFVMRAARARSLFRVHAGFRLRFGFATRNKASESVLRPAVDVAIIGGGVIGSSTALHLAAAAPQLRVAVFESDATYARASAPRSAGGIRQQFSLRANVELSIYGIEFLKRTLGELCEGTDVDTDVQFRENGYLILATPGSGEATLRENVAVQHAAGATWVSMLDPGQLRDRFPWLSTEGISLGSFGERNEGYFDPWALLQAMRGGALVRGVSYVPQRVEAMRRGPGGAISELALADGTTVSVGTVVNAAGPQGGHVVAMCGPDVTQLPVVPRKRCMWQFHVQGTKGGAPVPADNTPLTILPSGAYFRSEGVRAGNFVCGKSPRPEDDNDYDAGDPSHFEALECVDEDLFQEEIWPALAERVPALEALRVQSSWAGFYEYNTLDQNGVIGWHSEVPNLMIACGFSGHGLQQAPGVGRACTELLLHKEFTTVDVSCFGYDRIKRQEPIFERGIY